MTDETDPVRGALLSLVYIKRTKGNKEGGYFEWSLRMVPEIEKGNYRYLRQMDQFQERTERRNRRAVSGQGPQDENE